MYSKNYCRIPTSETSIYLQTFTCAHTYKYIVRCYQGDTHQTAPKSGANQWWKKSHFKDYPHHGVRSQLGISSKGPVCLGDLLQRSSFWVGRKLLFIPFWHKYLLGRYVSGHRTSVPGIVVADSCFPGRSVHYHSFFALHPSGFLCPASYSPSGRFGLSLSGAELIRDVLGLWLRRYPSLSVFYWVAFVVAAVRYVDCQNFHSAVWWSGGERGAHRGKRCKR